MALTGNSKGEYIKKRRIIKEIIHKITPIIVHVIGAENEDYSLAALDIPENIPVIVQMQTLLNDPDFIRRSPIYSDYKRACEIQVLQRVDYIGTTVLHFRELITSNIVKKTNPLI